MFESLFSSFHLSTSKPDIKPHKAILFHLSTSKPDIKPHEAILFHFNVKLVVASQIIL